MKGGVKMYEVRDYYVNYIDGDVVGTCKTYKEALKLCKEFEIDTNNLCVLEILEVEGGDVN